MGTNSFWGDKRDKTLILTFFLVQVMEFLGAVESRKLKIIG